MTDDDDIQEYVNPNKQRNDVLEEVAKEIEKMKAFDLDAADELLSTPTVLGNSRHLFYEYIHLYDTI